MDVNVKDIFGNPQTLTGIVVWEYVNTLADVYHLSDLADFAIQAQARHHSTVVYLNDEQVSEGLKLLPANYRADLTHLDLAQGVVLLFTCHDGEGNSFKTRDAISKNLETLKMLFEAFAIRVRSAERAE